jgi:DNA-binding GntR family transcriptional regulator
MESLTPAARRGLADEVTDRLRTAILDGVLQPGERAGEAELSRMLSVSRGPVREALVRLEQEGLVVSQWHRGATVVELTKADVSKLASLRTVLEQLAITEACQEAAQEDFDKLRGVVDQMRAARLSGANDSLVRLDVEFHDTICRAARHARLYAAWTTIRSQVALSLARRRAVADDYVGLVVPEHDELVRVLEGGDADRARELIATHLEGAYSRLLASFDRDLPLPPQHRRLR